LNVLGKVALDIGLSTGGFTDCLIGLGIDKVIGIDVGHGQIHSKLQGHRKLVAIEGLNAKEMKSNSVFLDEMPKAGFDLLVMDLSFISVLAVLPFALDVLAPSAHLIILIKPQFEAGPNALDKNGIIRDPKLYPELLQRLASGIERLGCKIEMQFESFPPGKDGNREFFFCAKKT
jgi:23S rRNA (cytidine1920-2'-O)/16S rRNA (cytidine1409-2'-O)-methyltransferase